ncbi:PREDICTED: centriolar coiled-coil protein of 110 kDa [Gekko japonicus]|uniref:Centriolar coiled-coil protein of 110 kDa n=1 Tax=Gekko japonicus TaxID=146911 RepID=A0ABM1KD06_GEKJA|nr:PREDICTED: centriolar coiled-coil protein of 110 kDa [Gekko japonicus]
MEDYGKFCAKHLARLQGEALHGEMPGPVAQHSSVSLIQFHGVPVLPPLLSIERKKEIQQDRQKALDFELWRQNSRKRILLNRVQEILENVQMNKLSSPSDLDPSGMEKTCSAVEPQVINGFVSNSNSVLPSSTALSCSTEPHKTLEAKPADAPVESDGNLLRETEQLVPDKQEDVCPALFEKRGCPEGSFAIPGNLLPSNETAKQENVEMGLAAVEAPDPYVMSLQNLLKKSREYIQREQNRRSLRSSSKRSISESLSDKENDAVKISDSMKERGKLVGRSYTAMTLDKPNLTSLQGTSVPKNSTRVVASSSFSKVDIPMRSGTPPVLDSDSDEDFKNTSLFDHDNSLLRSLTGSYSKLPSPEPSMSPKMHRRRPRPSSMGHIVINNPINAYELSPNEKGRAVGLIGHTAGDKTFASDPVPKLTPDFAPVCSSETAFNKSASDISDESVAVKQDQVCHLPPSEQESRGFPTSAVAGGGGALMTSDSRGTPTTCFSAPSLQELPAAGSPVATQNAARAGGAKQASLPDKAKCSAVTELNKSYDVESPSPLLMQTQHPPQMDTPNAGSEHVLENSFEKVKRRLELDADNGQKENVLCGVRGGASEPEKRRLHDQRGPVGAAFTAKNEAHGRGSGDEEALKTKMLALEDMRKRLEEQHAQQLSLLIAEQEREQERLQKEIEEQERRLKGEKAALAGTEVPPITVGSGVDLQWRKISDPRLLESVLTQVETLHNANSESMGFVNAKLGSTADTPFYLWEPPANMKSVSASRSISRSKMRWSQVYSPEMKRKLNKISALAKGFLTRRLLQTEKLKHLQQTVKDTREFIRNFQSEAPLKRGAVSVQDASLQERVVAQLRAALFDIHDIFFKMEVSERMNILHHDREVRKEKMLRQLDKAKTPRDRVSLSIATQKSLDRKKYMKATEMGMPNKKTIVKQKTPENRVLQPNQGQNAPIQRLLSRQGTPKASVKGAEQNRKKPSESRVSNKARSGVYAGKIQRKKPSVVTT